MNSNQAMVKWSELYNVNVVDPKEGKILGKVEDFFFKEGSNAIYALCVRTRLYGDLSLPVIGITGIEGGQSSATTEFEKHDRVTVRNAQMLLKALPPLGSGQKLISRKVVDGKGHELGTVKDVLLGTEPISAMRVAGLEIAHGSHSDRLGADGVGRYDDANNTVIVSDAVAKKWR